MQIDDLYQELIIDHGTEPRNCRVLENANHEFEGFNPLCGDKVHVYVLVENDIIRDVSFKNKGCAISTASASIMTEMLKGITIAQAHDIFKQFQHLLTSEEEPTESLGKLAALVGVRKFPSRVKCATLAWHTLQQALNAKDYHG